MNMILAFHGTFDGNTDALEDFDTFMSLSEQYHAGQKWVTYMYHPDMAGYDNCPVTMGWGKSYSQIDSYIYHDQAFLNFNNIRPPDYSSYYFKAGCEPGGAITPLPSSSPAHR